MGREEAIVAETHGLIMHVMNELVLFDQIVYTYMFSSNLFYLCDMEEN